MLSKMIRIVSVLVTFCALISWNKSARSVLLPMVFLSLLMLQELVVLTSLLCQRIGETLKTGN